MTTASINDFKSFLINHQAQWREEYAHGFEKACELVSLLPTGRPGLFNPWVDVCEYDAANSREDRLFRLALHLSCEPRFILCGEAGGYMGMRYSGVTFTSERLILEGAVPRLPKQLARLTSVPGKRTAFSEPSATIVWGALKTIGIENETVMWNALQVHPFKAGDVHSNRTPTREELELGGPALSRLLAFFPQARLVAVGNKSQELLVDVLQVTPHACVRHPANGGATKFREGMYELSTKLY